VAANFQFFRGNSSKGSGGAVSATLGNFDGVHLGHQKILKQLKEKSGETFLISFYPHPALVLGKEKEVRHLTSLRQKIAILKKYELSGLWLMHFTKQLSQVSAADFVDLYLDKQFHAQQLVIGEDARIGKGGEGNAKWLAEYFKKKGRNAEVVPFALENKIKIGSQSIRMYLLDGEVKSAERLLGRPYSIIGRVAAGKRIGKRLGFPTANISIRRQLLPKNGIYVTVSVVKGELYQSVTSVGVNPTFPGGEVTVETHLLDYQGSDFYREICEVFFIERLRDEQKFADSELLKDQIKKDINLARKSLSAAVIEKVKNWL
jgi:riboflavin kinase/FMN adenylyltransferase